MGRKKRNLAAFSPAHPTDLTLFVPLTISRGSFVKPPLDPAKLFIREEIPVRKWKR
jgi:hypothetical protein